jgi:hypothetical protein
MAAIKIKQITESHTTYQQHKITQNTINEIREILHRDYLIITRADKNTAIVIIEREALNQKIEKFIQDNNILQIAKDSTKTYQSQIQQLLQTSNLIIDKEKRKYLINGNPAAPKLNALIKSHKEGTPIRPVINSTQVPSYKTCETSQ